MAIRVFSDFDGTVTVQDTLVYLLDRYIGPSWLEIEERVEAGTLSEEAGLQAEIALLSPPWEEARDAVLAEVPVDPGFAPFAAWCREQRWPLTLLSGGLEPLIRAVLEREGLGDLALRANSLEFDQDGRWRAVPADSPRIRARCNHCKTWHLAGAARAGARTVYIGDGCTDRCPAEQADLVFAKEGLRSWCEKKGLPYRPFDSFTEIQDWFESEEGLAWSKDREE
jgi:2-hydroxy-3-keto-5-methylthiopentenyl-1-phosphate phosphatase